MIGTLLGEALVFLGMILTAIDNCRLRKRVNDLECENSDLHRARKVDRW